MSIVEALLFVDDSGFVKFDDASSLQLSSCGAVFRFSSSAHDEVANRHVLYGKDTQQFSQFATTLWKERVKLALDFRNKFAKVPYICCHLIGTKDIVEKNMAVNMCTWPGADKVKIIHHPDGSVTIKSLEDNAAVTLSACRQTFATKLLHQIPCERQDNSGKYLYTCVEQVYSVYVSYPRHFHYPVNILLNANGVDSLREDDTSYIVTEIPRSLALNCKKAHMHRWRKHLVLDEIVGDNFKELKSLKVLYSKGVFFRYYHQKYFISEAILPDGSVIRSEGPTQLYFKHWTYDFETTKVNEHIYTIKALPLDKKSQPYTISKIIKTSNRYLKRLTDCGGEHGIFTCCWKSADDPLSIYTLSNLELESNIYVRGVGAFKTYNNGRVHIVFSDEAIMDFIQPNQKQSGDIEVEQGYKQMIDTQTTPLVNDNVFKLILPNGLSYMGRLYQQPAGIHERYVHAALEFIEWRRYLANKTLNLNDEKDSVVAAELGKLKRFNSLSEPQNHSLAESGNSHIQDENIDCGGWQRPDDSERHKGSLTLWGANRENFGHTQLDIGNMQDHLHDTRRTVDEIEAVLKKCRRHLTKR